MPKVSSNRISLFLLGLVMISLAAVAESKGRLTYQTVHGAGLEDNLLGDSPNRQVMVYLPPSYTTTPTKRYPTIYLLHGYNGTSTIWRDGAYKGFNILTAMDELIEAAKGHSPVFDIVTNKVPVAFNIEAEPTRKAA